LSQKWGQVHSILEVTAVRGNFCSESARVVDSV
jgi:hypothetical protein